MAAQRITLWSTLDTYLVILPGQQLAFRLIYTQQQQCEIDARCVTRYTVFCVLADTYTELEHERLAHNL